MRKSLVLRYVPLAILLIIGFFCSSQASGYISSWRRHRIYSVALRQVINNESFTKEQNCKAYFELLASSLKEDSLLRDVGAKKAWIRTFVENIRAYGACFVMGDTDVDEETVASIERKLFPFFTGEDPVVTKWDGRIVKPTEREQKSFWGHRRASFSGKGIAISMSDRGVEEAKALLRVLRYLENELPIEFVHRGDLSSVSVDALVSVARSDLAFESTKNSICPPQEIYFVDASRAINQDMANLFYRFANKWVAALFSSFDEMILMDTDVVPFLKPIKMFDYDSYKKSGALFFRDRFTKERTWTTPMGFFRSLFASPEERKAFELHDYRQLAENSGFFKSKSKHVMESGMVVMKRSTHLSGLLLSTAMQFWHETSGPFYGDKELFWLGQAYAGEASFSFNEKNAAAIGELEKRGSTISVCSAQPAQFDDGLQLLWLNGGLRKCKKGFFKQDFKALSSLRTKYKTPEDLHAYYRSPVTINGAVIPLHKENFVQDRSKGCIGYIWCASVKKGDTEGSIIEFSDEKVDFIKRVVDIWYGDVKN